jgi:hypothetical protein
MIFSSEVNIKRIKCRSFFLKNHEEEKIKKKREEFIASNETIIFKYL